jgi:hypothetical protein
MSLVLCGRFELPRLYMCGLLRWSVLNRYRSCFCTVVLHPYELLNSGHEIPHTFGWPPSEILY